MLIAIANIAASGAPKMRTICANTIANTTRSTAQLDDRLSGQSSTQKHEIGSRSNDNGSAGAISR